jgi:hypothetical protein
MQLSANNTYTVPEGFTARITLEAVPTLAKGWNPAGLYQQTVGTEYRLLTPEEHKFFLQNLDADRSGVEMYSVGTWENCSVDSDYQTCRVPLSWVHPSLRNKEKTPEQILAAWIATYDVKVGDLVRVTGAKKASPWCDGPGMNETIGEVFRVKYVPYLYAIKLENDYNYSPLDLEKVTETQVPLEKEDWEGEWYIRSSDGLRIYKVTSTSSHMVYSGPHHSYRYDTLSNGCQRSRDLQSWTPCTKTTYIPTPPNPINQAKNAEECHF